ncbi:MAG: hypothetical protein GXO12_05545 [Epsilonproteobacteria bacterium]|nr:hypothetical protein [Campylobacterota bacterium]
MSDKVKKVKEAIKKSDKLSNEHKQQALDKIQEWYIEDKAEGLLAEELMEITEEFLPILKEIGLL